jgi:hypothetical protein
MKWLRLIGAAAIALGIALLLIGWSISDDLLGFLFMVSLVVGVALLIADFVVRRGRRTTV